MTVIEMDKDAISAAIKEICSRYSGDRYEAGNWITPKKLEQVYKSFSIPESAQVFAIAYGTALRSGKKGVAICDDGLYIKNGKENVKVIEWAEFANCLIRKEFFYKIAVGTTVIDMKHSFFREDLYLLLLEIQDYLRGYETVSAGINPQNSLSEKKPYNSGKEPPIKEKKMKGGRARIIVFLIIMALITGNSLYHGSLLAKVCAKGSPGLVRLVFNLGVNPNVDIEKGITPLMCAAHSNDAEVIEFLIKQGAKVNEKDDGEGWTALMVAVSRNADLQALEMLIKYGADVNAIDYEGWTPLMYAAAYNNDSMAAEMLIKYGADVNARRPGGFTPLIYAAESTDNIEVIDVLIQNGAQVNLGDDTGWTPLLWAARYNEHPEVVIRLLQYGADPQARNSYGWRAVDLIEENEYLKGTDVHLLLQEVTY